MRWFDRRPWPVLVAALLAVSLIGAVGLDFSPDTRSRNGRSSGGIDATLADGYAGEAVIPGQPRVDRLNADQRDSKGKGLLLVLAMAAVGLAEAGRRRARPRPHRDPRPPVVLLAHPAPRRGPPLPQLV